MSRARRVASLLRAELSPPVRHLPRRLTPVQQAGIRYEEKFTSLAQSLWGPFFTPSQWFRYEDRNGTGFCQTDGLLRLAECIIIFEVKLSHRTEAWTQLAHLYGPVVERTFERPVRLCEVTRAADLRLTRWPEEPALLLDIDEFLSWVESGSRAPGVLLWK